VSFDQRERLRRAGAALALSRPALKGATVRLDLIALAPGRLPRHIPDAWKGG
jgi:putative endonuclease